MRSKANYIFEHKDEVRDYECDIQGIVNNANYQHYMEHARHKFLQSKGLSFSELHNRGIDAVVSRIEIEYKSSLRGGEEYVCRLSIEKVGVRYVFIQDIYRVSDEKLCTKAKVDVVCLINGKLSMGCPELDGLVSNEK